MDLASEALQRIKTVLDDLGWRVDFWKKGIYIFPLELDVNCELEQLEKKDPWITGCFIISASHPQYLPKAIREHCTGFGTNQREFIEMATNHWISNAFRVIHGFLCNMESDESMSILDMLTQNCETREKFAWKVIMGPLEFTKAEKLDINNFDNNELFKELVGPLSAMLLDRKVHWMKCFIGSVPGHVVKAECRFDNDLWNEGNKVLSSIGKAWDPVDFYKLRRQFTIFEPCTMDSLKNRSKLEQAFTEQFNPEHGTPKKWWQFWR